MQDIVLGLPVGRGAVPFAKHSPAASHHAAFFICTPAHEEA